MYDPMGEFKRIIKANKKCTIFNHESRAHIEYLFNKKDREVEASPEWEFCMLDKEWLALKGVKKYRVWEIK